MAKNEAARKDAAARRRRAEEQIRRGEGGIAPGDPGISPADPEISPDRIRHELQVHKIELELQAGELERTRADVETSLARYVELYDFAPIGYFTCDREGVIREANLTGAGLLARSRDELLNRPFFIFVAPASREDFHSFLTEVFATGGRRTCKLELLKKDAPPLPVSLVGVAVRDETERPVQCRCAVLDMSERLQAERRQAAEEERYLALLDNAAEAVVVADLQGNIVEANKAAEDLCGYSRAELAGMHIAALHPPAARENTLAAFHNIVRGGVGVLEDAHVLRKDGTTTPVAIRGSVVAYGGRRLALGLFRSKETQLRLERKVGDLQALLAAVKAIQGALLRMDDEAMLFQQICAILTGVPYIRFVWLGLAAAGREVRPVAWAGFEAGYLSHIRVAWDDSEYGQGPTGMAIKTGRPFVLRDMEAEPAFRPWREEARQRGYRSSVALPLVHPDGVIGALNIYAGVPDAFGDDEVRFLAEMAENVSVGVRLLRLVRGLQGKSH